MKLWRLRAGGVALIGALLATVGCAPEQLLVKAPRVAADSRTIEGGTIGAPGGAASQTAVEPDKSVESGSVEIIQSMPREALTPPKTDQSSRFSSKDKLTVAVEGMPLKNFLNYVFGELLKTNFVIAETGQVLDQPVTLNTQQSVSSRQLYRLATELLAGKGLSVVEKDGVFLIGPVTGKGAGDVVIGFGRKASDVPDVAGKILQIVPWRFGQNISVERLILQLVEVTTQPGDQQNALFLSGTRPAVLRALELIRMLDQPTARSSRIGLISLTYLDAKEFIAQVSTLLENEGITAGEGRADGKSIAFVPLERLGSIVVFAPTSESLSRVEFWSKQLDKPSRGPSLRYFIYQPKYARALDLIESLAPLIGSTSGVNVAGNQSRDTRSAVMASPGTVMQPNMNSGATVSSTGPVSVQGEGITLSADLRSNSLIAYTTGTRYEGLLPTIRRLDVPPKQILLEATIAEVSLTGEFANGVEFVFQDGKLSGGTEGSLGLPSGGIGLSYVASITDRARLRLSSGDSRINVLSNPILVVRDGIGATISVGNDVPTLGSIVSNPLQSNTTVQSIQYRQTGINLNIKPTINSQGSVMMTITQSISSSVPGGAGVAGSPTFFTRNVSTEVVARSGQSVLLAGLISDSNNQSSSRVPFLSRIPLAGLAFRSDSKKREKTELILLITPRIIDSLDQWDEVKSSVESALDYIAVKPGVSAAGHASAERGR